jgi:hypothetical protein
MPTNDLSGLSDLDDKCRAVLAEKLAVTSCYGLILTDRRRIVDAFGRRSNRPSLEEVAVWQDEARRLIGRSIDAPVSTIDASAWEPVALFVVAFEERHQGGVIERRILAEQTEVEPDAAPQQRAQWPDWSSGDTCRWMEDRARTTVDPVRSATTAPMPAADPIRLASPSGAAVETERMTPSIERTRLRIERATLRDAGGDVELVAVSRLLPAHRSVWIEPERLVVALEDGLTGPGTKVVLQVESAGTAVPPLDGHFDSDGRAAVIDLRGLPDGEYELSIVVWRPDGSNLARVVKFPAVVVARGRRDAVPRASPNNRAR